MKDFKHGEWVEEISYELAFDDGCGNGFAFPCDKDGNVNLTNPAAEKNYKYCLAHPDEFNRWNKVSETKWSYRENNSGVCNCGNRIELVNEYLGACECPHCGQWWNLWGQELIQPTGWDMDDHDYYEEEM